ncbi:MAG: 4Fe-4S binding protein [Dehalococcoidales bacterium]|nr:4Fe-4S binding protein [Dehalococcoidales bacterium]
MPVSRAYCIWMGGVCKVSDQNKCLGCGDCQSVCPADVIQIL